MHPIVVILIVGAIYVTIDHYAEQRRIRHLLAAVDEEWNGLINQHHKAIAEAYMDGKTVKFNIDRR